ncbi:MAG TPA: arsinothricin resistance N-acetyltransferase ArsN1 family B [Rhodanobacteraceae bacterium]|nr:arsinothricin resistance N-acetyltransferase ArsN1 family B [Rhodanobacteraceae bacterium]
MLTHTGMSTDIKLATGQDTLAICAIYNHYVAKTCTTFETEPVSTDDMAARIERAVHASLPWLIAVEQGRIAGYAYAVPWRARSAYRRSVELSVYLDRRDVGRGIGTRLYGTLLDSVREQGMHAVIGGVALPNRASVALHERFGFRKVAHFEQVGHKLGRWVDVGYWQLLL